MTDKNKRARPPFVAIGALARLILEARCTAFPDETEKLIHSVELYAKTQNNLPIPLPHLKLTGHLGRWLSGRCDEFYHGHIDHGPYYIGEGQIVITEGVLPITTWNSLTSRDMIGKPASSIVDLGPEYDAPIEEVRVENRNGDPQLFIIFDNRPVHWHRFKTDLLARHQPEGTPRPG